MSSYGVFSKLTIIMSWGHYSVIQRLGPTFPLSNDPKWSNRVDKPVGLDGFA